MMIKMNNMSGKIIKFVLIIGLSSDKVSNHFGIYHNSYTAKAISAKSVIICSPVSFILIVYFFNHKVTKSLKTEKLRS